MLTAHTGRDVRRTVAGQMGVWPVEHQARLDGHLEPSSRLSSLGNHYCIVLWLRHRFTTFASTPRGASTCTSTLASAGERWRP